jgi:hypothetical protein
VEPWEPESPELGLEFLVPELKGVVSESLILGWFPAIRPLPGYCC